MNILRNRRGSVLFVALMIFVGLGVLPATAQPPEQKSLEVFSDNSCNITLGTFMVPAGRTATNFVFSYQSSWQACQGPDRMDWITFGIRGGLSGMSMYECTEFFDKRPAQEKPGPIGGIVAQPGTYVVYLLSGRNSTVHLAYELSGGAAPTPEEVKPVTAYRDNACNLFPGGFKVGPGCTASNFRFRLDSPWRQCSGPERVSEINFIIRGPAGDIYEYREYYDQRPPEERLGPLSSLVLSPANYTLLLGSGRDTYLTLNYDLDCSQTATPTVNIGANSVKAYRDNGCNLFPGGFQVGPGCTASNFSSSLNTQWMQCSGPENVSEINFIIRGPNGDVYECRQYYDPTKPTEERLGPLSSLVLSPGNYVLLLGSGRDTALTLNYDLNCPQAAAPGPGYKPATLLAEINTNFTSWYVKRWGSGDASVFRLGSDPQGTKNFTWKETSKDVISDNDITIPAPGRIFIDAAFHMEDRPEFDTPGYLYAVGTVYPQLWVNNSWQNPAQAPGDWQNYIGYAGSREVLPSKGFEYAGRIGGPIQIFGTGLAVQPGKFRVSILSAIARDWVVHYPSTGKIYVYFVPDK